MPPRQELTNEIRQGSMIGNDAFVGVIVSRDDIKDRHEDVSDQILNDVFDYLQKKFGDILCETDFYWEVIDGAVTSIEIESNRKLTCEKHCQSCNGKVNTYFEKYLCEKNPNGLKISPISHGNEIKGMTTCADDYCKPDIVPLEKSEINQKVLDDHEIAERCEKCHQEIKEKSN